MARTISKNFIDAVELAHQGHTAQQLIEAGVPQATAYRAVRVAKTGQVLSPKTPTKPPEVIPPKEEMVPVDAETGEIKPRKAGYTYRLPVVGGKVVSRSQAIAGDGAMVQDYFDPGAQALAMVTRVSRVPMPRLLPILIAITKLEWKWASIPVDQLLDIVIDCFLRDRGILAGAYHKLPDVEEFIQEVKGNEQRGTGISSGSPSSTSPGTSSTPAANQQATGDNQETPGGVCGEDRACRVGEDEPGGAKGIGENEERRNTNGGKDTR